MAQFKIVTHVSNKAKNKANNSDLYAPEMEALSGIDAEIIEFVAMNDEEFIEATRDADVIFGNSSLSMNRTIIESLEKCKAIILGSVGSDKVDITAATECGIPVTNVPDTFIEEVADHTLMLILATYRRVTHMDTIARNGNWADGRSILYGFPRLMGQTLGFISFGHVARAVSKRAMPFGFRMLAHDPYIEELVASQHGVEPVSLTEILQRSDIISMHAPGTDTTDRMLQETHFRLMKPNALFINTGRGATVNENALIQALEKNWIAGAGIDVMEKEPPDLNNPLLRMKNVIITPHVASASARFNPSRKLRMGQEISLILNGQWPMSCVNPAVLEKSKLKRWQPYSMERGPAR